MSEKCRHCGLPIMKNIEGVWIHRRSGKMFYKKTTRVQEHKAEPAATQTEKEE